MQKKGKKSPLTGVVVAAVLVVVLAAAGTVLRMNSRDMQFLPAFKSFLADTFMMDRQN